MIFDGLGEDLLGGLGPYERLGALVVALDEVLDRGDQLGDVVVDAAADLLFGQDREPDLDHVQPGRARGGEVEVHAFVPLEPALDLSQVVARAAAIIELSDEEERVLRSVLRTPSSSQQQALRARIVLRAAEGVSNTQIAREVGVSLPTVGLWRRSFCERRLEGLRDAPRSGRPRQIDDDQVKRVLAKTLEPPPDGTTHWSVRRLAEATGISPTTVHRIWREYKLKPHQVRSFKFANDPGLVEKVIDVVGLYLDPPKGALVLCVDEHDPVTSPVAISSAAYRLVVPLRL